MGGEGRGRMDASWKGSSEYKNAWSKLHRARRLNCDSNQGSDLQGVICVHGKELRGGGEQIVSKVQVGRVAASYRDIRIQFCISEEEESRFITAVQSGRRNTPIKAEPTVGSDRPGITDRTEARGQGADDAHSVMDPREPSMSSVNFAASGSPRSCLGRTALRRTSWRSTRRNDPT